MSFDLRAVLDEHRGENFRLYSQNVNPQLVRVLRSIGFDSYYERGEGAYVFDQEGEKYLDFLSGFGVYALGRSHPVIQKALHDAIDADLPNLLQMDAPLLVGVLAKEILSRCHDQMGRVFFTSSGTEAVEAALKFSRAATGRSKIAYCDHGFHGLTLGALSANGGKEFRKGFGQLLPSVEVAFGDSSSLEKALQKRDVAAFIVEPVQGKTLSTADSQYWDDVEAMCRKYGTLLIADEIQTGLGRTGKLWAHEHWGLTPDIITMSKALSGGFIPVGAMVCSTEVSEKVFSSMQRAMAHSSTFGKNQIAMVAALATLQTIDDENIVDRARVTGDAFEKGLAPLIDRYEFFKGLKGKGLMMGLEFGEPSALGAKIRYSIAEATHKGLFSQFVVGPLFQKHRILTQVAADGLNVVKVLPPLIIGQTEVDYFVDALDDVLSSAQKSSSMINFGTTLAKAALRRDR